ncbi:MAG TPA: SagB/ThcOx family dehydrogenase [Candidatus Korarchaeota archaeon]|nr:SagB/ThcOx family dehydrogenase [Candidatus Korarchaeota archaeon]
MEKGASAPHTSQLCTEPVRGSAFAFRQSCPPLRSYNLDIKRLAIIYLTLKPCKARYGERGIRYVHIEVGCVAQNIYLQCTSLDLATVCIEALIDEDVSSILGLEESEVP